MKVNLLLDNAAGVRPGYVNVDMLAPPGDPLRVQCDPTELDTICDAGECEDLLAMEILDYIPLAQANKVLDHWLSRVAHGGTITVSTIDLLEVSRAFHNRFMSIEEANFLLHGEQKKQWQFRQATYTLGQLANGLKARNFELVMQRNTFYRAVVVGRRP